jgi:hypothetical protein
LVEARALVLEGEQVLVISRRSTAQGGDAGMLLDTDLVRLSQTVRRFSITSPRLHIQGGGVFMVKLGSEAVATALKALPE